MFSFRNEKKWIKLTLFLIISVVFIISTLVVLKYNNYFLLGNYDKADNDDVKYIRSAVTFLQKGVLSYHDVNQPTDFIMPGLTILLSQFIKLFGIWQGVAAFRVFQVILQVLCLLMIFFIARHLFGSAAGVMACLLDSLYLPELYSSGLILTESIFKFLLLLLVCISLYALKTKNLAVYALGGLILGIACLFRPTIALFPIVILIMWIIEKYSFRDIIKFTLVTSAVFILVMSPWWIRNYNTFHKFIPLTKSSGSPFLQGTYIGYNSCLKDPEYLKYNGTGNNSEMEFGKKRLVKMIKETPIRTILWYTMGKTLFYWALPFYWKRVLGVSEIIIIIYHGLLIISGVYGIIRSIKTNPKINIALLVMLYFNFVHLPYLTLSRYSFPVMPLMIIFSAYACITFMGNKVKNKIIT